MILLMIMKHGSGKLNIINMIMSETELSAKKIC